MSTLIDVDLLLEEYLISQERLSNSYSERIIEYYSHLEGPVLIANLTRICSLVQKKGIPETKRGSMNLALYAPISVDVLAELAEEYNTVLTPPIVQSILKETLPTLQADLPNLPLRSVNSCIKALNGTYINLLAEAVALS
jgi:hypothetical protein